MLTNQKQQEILLITQEECAEVTQAISKCFRFGIDGLKPGKPKTNREHLEEEAGDLLCMIQLMMEHGLLEESKVYAASLNKRTKLQTWSSIFKKELVDEQN
jgi:NTP pyrophosphatase (non-canonical NTP hydrolase)